METFKLPEHQLVAQPELRTCGNCVHAISERMEGVMTPQLVCHRFPPQIVLIPMAPQKSSARIAMPGQPEGIRMQAQSMFPPVNDRMFCHSHTHRLEDPTAAVAVAEPGAVG